MLPRQPSKLPITEPTMRPPISATKTRAGPSASAWRMSSTVSVALTVAPACRHKASKSSASSRRQRRMQKRFDTASDILEPSSTNGVLHLQDILCNRGVRRGHYDRTTYCDTLERSLHSLAGGFPPCVPAALRLVPVVVVSIAALSSPTLAWASRDWPSAPCFIVTASLVPP